MPVSFSIFSLEPRRPYIQKVFLILYLNIVFAQIYTQKKSHSTGKIKQKETSCFICSERQPARVVSSNYSILSWKFLVVNNRCLFFGLLLSYCPLEGLALKSAAEGLLSHASVS